MYAPSKKSRLRSGFTLIEIAIVLGVIGLVISAIWVAAQQVSNSREAQKATTQIMQILNGYRSLYAQHGIDTACPSMPWGGFCDVTCMGIENNYFPSDMAATCVGGITGTYTTHTPWGGGSNVAVLTQQPNNTILITYNDIPQAACVNLASATFNAPDVTYQAIYSGAGGGNHYLPPYGAGTPYTISDITGLCATATGNTVQIGYTAH